MKGAFANDALTIHVGTVEATEIAENEDIPPQFDDAMLLGYDSVQKLNRIAGVASEGVVSGKLDDLLPFRGREQQSGH
jgi:hypothetical protein